MTRTPPLTILLAEDDPSVRSLARTILTRSGYTVLEASDGDKAVELAAQHNGPIDLLLTDIAMPGTGGRALDARLTEMRPKLKTLFMSGDPTNAIVREGATVIMAPFLPKPFTQEMLVRAVRTVLDG